MVVATLTRPAFPAPRHCSGGRLCGAAWCRPQTKKMTSMETNQEYQSRELRDFLRTNRTFFTSVAEFAARLETMDIPEQAEWVANGSFGAGASFALQRAIVAAGANPRRNGRALVGQVLLKAFYGADFPHWRKLPAGVRATLDAIAADFLTNPPAFGQKWEGGSL